MQKIKGGKIRLLTFQSCLLLNHHLLPVNDVDAILGILDAASEKVINGFGCRTLLGVPDGCGVVDGDDTRSGGVAVDLIS